jgi:hypothetical protein
MVSPVFWGAVSHAGPQAQAFFDRAALGFKAPGLHGGIHQLVVDNDVGAHRTPCVY